MRVVVLAAVAGCSFSPPGVPSDASGDSGEGTIDSPPSALHLLLSEIETDNGEMIEIYNPTDTPIDLSQNYYLSDHNEYWRLPEHAQSPITLDASDFLVRFPADSPALPPGGVAVIAINGIAFRATYSGQSPDYTILVEAGQSRPMDPIVPLTTPSLTNTGEMVVLFYWDGESDLVRDVDLVVVGSNVAPANAPVAKLAVDGPDADTMPTAYAAEVLDLGELGDTAADRTHKRIERERDREVHGAGNGITGDDETSEAIQVTWDMRDSAGTPGAVPASLQTP
jgi:hypothetical protein